jgi:hypothetical protein
MKTLAIEPVGIMTSVLIRAPNYVWLAYRVNRKLGRWLERRWIRALSNPKRGETIEGPTGTFWAVLVDPKNDNGGAIVDIYRGSHG